MTQVLAAIVVTAATTFFVTAILFMLLYKLAIAQKCHDNEFESVSHHVDTTTDPHDTKQQEGTLKGIIVAEGDVKVLYVKEIDKGKLMGCFSKVWINPMKEEENYEEQEEEEKRMDRRRSIPKNSVPIQEMPLLHDIDFTANICDMGKPNPVPSPPPPPPPSPPPLPPSPPPPQPPKTPAPPPPPPKAGGLMTSSLKPPSAPKWEMIRKEKRPTKEGEKGETGVQMKLKSLHWDKVNIANVDQSMVWNDINDGSLR